MQPVLNRFRLNLVETKLAPARDDVRVEIEFLLLSRGLRDLVCAAEIANLVHSGDLAEHSDAGQHSLLYRLFCRRRVQLREELVAFNLSLFLRDDPVALAGSNLLVLA